MTKQWHLLGEVATPVCRNIYLHKAFRLSKELRRAGTLSRQGGVARNDELRTFNPLISVRSNGLEVFAFGGDRFF